MAYIFISSINIIIQFTVFDFINKSTDVLIDLNTKDGKRCYKEIYGVNPVESLTHKLNTHNVIMEQAQDLDYIFAQIKEKSKRLLAGFLAKIYSIKKVVEITRLAKTTITKGLKELNEKPISNIERIRKTGGGRKKIEERYPNFLITLEKIIDNDIAGDPMTSRKWIRKTLRRIKELLELENIDVSLNSIRKGLKMLGISLRKNMKYINKRNHPDRDIQFKEIKKQRNAIEDSKNPNISMDGKAKKLIGDYLNNGKTWCKLPEKVNDHDFPGKDTKKLAPYGIYDLKRNDGYLYCGISSETSEFAVDSLVWWWQNYGSKNYPDADKIYILCDGGGSNGHSRKRWKYDIQMRFVNVFGIDVCVSHYPPGTSKYNPIEHRLFSFISKNWAGIPLRSIDIALGYIRSTTTKKNLNVYAELTTKTYLLGIKTTDEQMDSINLNRNAICPNWNYTISPNLNIEI